MFLRTFLTFAVVSMVCCAAMGTEPIDIGSRLELMVDDYLIERMSGGAELRLHRPVEREVVFTCDKPWEGNHSGTVTVFQDGDIYRMYYRAADWQTRDAHNYICYAESKDGIHWTRPELGLIEFKGSKENNIILPCLGKEGVQCFVPLRDTNPDCKPDEQYKALALLQDNSRLLLEKSTNVLCAYASGDGIHWRQMRKEPVITKGKFDSQNVAFWDSERGHYVAYVRELRGPNDEILRKGPELGPDGKGLARDVMTCTSPDFLNWTEPKWLQYPGAPREQIYLNQIRPYYRAPHIFVGFPGRFILPREIEKGLPITKLREFAAVSDTLFMTSRDGVNFKRWGEAFVRPGPSKERWIYPGTFPRYGLLVTKADTVGMPDELSLYVDDGGFWTQRGEAFRLRRYTSRIDGFVSVEAPLSGGEFVTKPLVFQGKELVMNFATSAAGSVRVEIQTTDGKPVEGFTLADCPEIFGDQIEQVVTFKDGSDVSHLAGKPIRLRFVLKDADLYSIRFHNYDY